MPAIDESVMKRQQLHSQPHQLERAANVDPNKVVAPPFGVRLRVVARQAPSSGLSCYGTQSDGKPPFIADLGQQYPCFWCLVPPDYSLAQCRALGPGLRRCTRGSLVTCSLMVGLKTGAPFVPSACTRSCPQAMQSGLLRMRTTRSRVGCCRRAYPRRVQRRGSASRCFQARHAATAVMT